MSCEVTGPLIFLLKFSKVSYMKIFPLVFRDLCSIPATVMHNLDPDVRKKKSLAQRTMPTTDNA